MNKTIIVSNYVLFTVHTICRRLIENWILQNFKKSTEQTILNHPSHPLQVINIIFLNVIF